MAKGLLVGQWMGACCSQCFEFLCQLSMLHRQALYLMMCIFVKSASGLLTTYSFFPQLEDIDVFELFSGCGELGRQCSATLSWP